MDLAKEYLKDIKLEKQNENEHLSKKKIIYKTLETEKQIELNDYYMNLIKELENKKFYKKNAKAYKIILNFKDKLKNTKENRHKILEELLETLEKEFKLDMRNADIKTKKEIIQKLKTGIKFNVTNGDIVQILVLIDSIINVSLDTILLLSKNYVKKDLAKKLKENLEKKLDIKINVIVKELNDIKQILQLKTKQKLNIKEKMKLSNDELAKEAISKNFKMNNEEFEMIKKELKEEIKNIRLNLEKEYKKIQKEIEQLEQKQMLLEEELLKAIEEKEAKQQPKQKQKLEIKKPQLKPQLKQSPTLNISAPTPF